MARPPGRTQKIAYDSTPLNAASPDLNARTGWLLSMSRLHHPDASWHDGGRFVEALAHAGAYASRSLVSRWEAGSIVVSHEGLAGYERVLGLEPGRLSSVVAYLRAEGPDRRRRRVVGPRLDVSTSEFSARLDELLGKAETGAALPEEWQDLGWHLAAVPLVHLRSQTWEALTTRIVNLLPRSVNVAYRQLSTAAMTIASVERAQDYMVEAIATYLSDPDVQVVANPLVMLDHLPTRRAARLVLDVVARPQRSVSYQTGVWVARQKLVRGELTESEAAELQMLVLRTWRSDPAHASEHLAELIADLPNGMRSALVDAAVRAGMPKLGYVVTHGEDVKAPKAVTFAQAISDAARGAAPQEPSYDEDRMLSRLLREALFHRDTERRHAAALLISASPFAPFVADALLDRLSDSDPEWLRTRLTTLVRYLCGDSHRLRLLPLLSDRAEGVAVRAAQGLGHLRFDVTSDQQVRGALAKKWSVLERAKLYMLGMTGSPSLRSLSRAPSAPEWQRSAARWWLDLGPAVRG